MLWGNNLRLLKSAKLTMVTTMVYWKPGKLRVVVTRDSFRGGHVDNVEGLCGITDDVYFSEGWTNDCGVDE